MWRRDQTGMEMPGILTSPVMGLWSSPCLTLCLTRCSLFTEGQCEEVALMAVGIQPVLHPPRSVTPKFLKVERIPRHGKNPRNGQRYPFKEFKLASDHLRLGKVSLPDLATPSRSRLGSKIIGMKFYRVFYTKTIQFSQLLEVE